MEFEADPLKPPIQSFRNGKGTLVQHRPEEAYLCTFQLFFCAPDSLASGVVRFDDQDDSIGQLSNEGSLRLTAKRWRADEDVIKFLAQFGEALSITFHRRVKARLHQT